MRSSLIALLIKDGPAGNRRCKAFVALALSSIIATITALAVDLLFTGFSG